MIATERPVLAHTFRVVKGSDTIIYNLDAQDKLWEVINPNDEHDEYSYSDSSVSYTRYDKNGVWIGTFKGLLNSQGYFYRTVWQEEGTSSWINNYRYDSAGYLMRGNSDIYENGNLVRVIEYGKTSRFITYEYYTDLNYRVYPANTTIRDHYYHAVGYEAFPFILSPYYGRQSRNLIKRWQVVIEHWASGCTQTDTMSYSYQLDSNGYVISSGTTTYDYQ